MTEDEDPRDELPEDDDFRAKQDELEEAAQEEEETPEVEPESSVASESYDDEEPKKRRGCLSAILGGILLFPFRFYRPMVGERKMGSLGVVLFIILFPLWIYLYASPFVWYMSYNLSANSTARVQQLDRDQKLGVAYVDALIHCYESQMSHWMVNDRIAPTIWLDNPQNFQLGVREGLLYGTRVLRDNLSRLRSTDSIDPDVDAAFGHFSFNPNSWIFPSTEREYRKGVDALKKYRERLIRGEAPFHPRADNLAELLTQFNSVTGGANARLRLCTPDRRPTLSEETMGDPTLSGEVKSDNRAKWTEVDDHFYFARGVAYVYREIMVAVNYDFAEILDQRNAQELSDSLVEDFLDRAQFEPIYVARGSDDSLWANHPAKLLAHLSQVRERSRSLHTMVAIDVR